MQNESENLNPNRIYLDHNATTPVASSIKVRWDELFHLWGNPSSIHASSRTSKQWLRETRLQLSQILKCSPLELIFNSGASEGNSTVLKSVWQELGSARPEFLISHVEHPSVAKTAEYLQSLGAIIKKIPVSRDGQIDLEFLKHNLSAKTALVSVMFANNETGTIFPITKIANLAKSVGALVHSDCVQMFGKVKINFDELNVDYATFSGHKFYALKGTGVTYVRKGSPWVPLIYGGGQERSRRGGTENTLGIASLGIVLESYGLLEEKVAAMTKLRDQFESSVAKKIPNVTITAKNSPRISNTSNLIIDGVDGETMLMALDLKGFSVSTGAACSSGNPEPSPVLLAMGLTREQAQHSLRVSVGWTTTEQEIKVFIETLVEVVARLRSLNNLKAEYANSK